MTPEAAPPPEPGDILQVDPNLPAVSPAHWCAGRLVIVHRVEPWGIVAYIWSQRSASPARDRAHKPAFVRLGFDGYAPTGGKAKWRLGDGLVEEY